MDVSLETTNRWWEHYQSSLFCSGGNWWRFRLVLCAF